MIKEALQYLFDNGVKLAEAQAPIIDKTVEGRHYTSKELTPVKPPLITALTISTLGSLIELCSGQFGGDTEGFEGFDPKEHVLHVVDERTVKVVTAISNAWKVRETLIECKLAETNTFQFNKYLTQEDFIIGLLASFVDTEDRGPLTKLAGNATAEQVVTLVDDGVTQAISVKSGAYMQDSQTVKGMVMLAPWRTFRDVSQPKSQFLFRVKKDGDTPKFALFEADGGAWKLEAVENIARKLSAGLTSATVVS
jgi:hypothetical protein